VTLEVEVEHARWPLHQLAVHHRDHGLLHALGLAGAVEPLLEVHASPGVQVRVGLPRLLREPAPSRAPVPLQ
jgi:uncharacterized protein YqjF (DUF2071 family)